MTNSSGVFIGGFKDESRIKFIDDIVKDFATSLGYVLDHQTYQSYRSFYKAFLTKYRGIVFRTKENIFSTHGEEHLGTVTEFLQIECGNTNLALVRLNLFAFKEEADVSGYYKINKEVSRMEVIVRTQDITRKVILLGDVCVDYHRTDFPWASEEVVIPPFPLVGDLVSLNDGAIVNVLTVLETGKKKW